jgi:hypothetical protein
MMDFFSYTSFESKTLTQLSAPNYGVIDLIVNFLAVLILRFVIDPDFHLPSSLE